MTTSNEITELMKTEAYQNPRHPEYEKTNERVATYFEQQNPGTQTDATGRQFPVRVVFVWIPQRDDHVCQKCVEASKQYYDDYKDMEKHHPNCRCSIQRLYVDGNNEIVFDQKRKEIRTKTRIEEGGYVDNPKKIEQPTNAGIKQDTLNAYNKNYPKFNFPKKVKDLTEWQIDQIYDSEYYDGHKIGKIKNFRLASIVYDMGVMSDFKRAVKVIQNTLNEHQGSKLETLGFFGKNTIEALNNIPEDELDDFIALLKKRRIEYLKGLKGPEGWIKFGRGWEARTNRY